MKSVLLTALCLTLVILSGCSEDFLDRQPLDQVTSSNFYQTEEDAKQALVSVYDALQYQSSPGVSWAPFLTVSDILSDDCLGGGADANDGLGQSEMNRFVTPTTSLIVHSLWLKNYVGIYRANLYLEKIGEMDVSDEFRARTIAECEFMRAYFYLELVRFFENVPLLTRTLSGPSEYNQPQASSDAVYAQITTDLLSAIEGLPESVTEVENGRVTKWAAIGILARTYLFYTGVYGGDLPSTSGTVDRATVISYLEDLITSSGLELLPIYDEIFQKSGEFSSESVFEISHGDSPAWWDWGYLRGSEGNLAAQMQGPRVTGSTTFNRGWAFAPVAFTLYRDLENDPRRTATIIREDEIDGNLVRGYQHTGYFSRKYTSDAEHWGSDGQFEHNRTVNYRVVRYADILLMAAELGSANAQQYLDDVRARVGLPSVPATMDNILAERRLELSLEGVRYFDVLRQGLDVAASTFTQQGIRGPFYEGDQQLYDVQFDASKRGFFPIPQTEIDLSAGTFQQNAGY